MKQGTASLRIIFIAILICFAASISKSFCVVVDKIIAVVNGEVITQRELTWLLVPIYEQYKAEYTGKRLEDKMMEAEDRILNQLIDDKLILSEAKRQGIEVTEEEIEAKLETVKSNFETEEQFRSALAEQNMTLSELCDRFKDEIMKSKIVRKEVGWKVNMLPTEVRKYYDSHIEEFMAPENVKVLNILVKKDDNGKPKEDAKILIEGIKASIDRGNNFEELAKKYSEGPNAEEGGSLGLVERGRLMKEIDEVIFSLKIGEVSDIVETAVGYHIFKVTEKVPAKIIEFETAKFDIEDLIYKEKISSNLKKWLKELRKDASISIK